ncbi:hypothetical protein ACP70R_001730 [Stipagrostis hirtigluma subsp. patula]
MGVSGLRHCRLNPSRLASLATSRLAADLPGLMAGPRPLLPRFLRLAVVVCASCLPAPVLGIRKDIGLVAPLMCRSTVQGRHLITDDNGYVCSALAIDPWSHCCPETGARFSCQGCKLDLQCCNSYEYCVSCCLNPSKTKIEDVLKLKVAKPVTAGTYRSVFDFCMGRCRHSSASVVHENAYASDFHHCFSVQQNSSGDPLNLALCQGFWALISLWEGRGNPAAWFAKQEDSHVFRAGSLC